MPKGRRSDYAYQRNTISTQSFKPLPRRMQEGLEEAAELTHKGDLIAARTVLQDLDRQYPNRAEILTDLVNVNLDLHDYPNVISTCERLINVEPHNPEAHLSLAGAYLHSVFPSLALRQYRHFLKQFSAHEYATKTRETVLRLQLTVAEMQRDAGFVGPDGPALAEKHEQAQVYLAQSNFVQGRRLCEELIRVRPDLISSYNNLSLLHYSEGHYEDAIAVAGRALEIDPTNLHVLSNLTRFYCLTGYLQEARQMADRLQALPQSDNTDLSVKKAEAFSFMGDDQTVLDVALAVEQTRTQRELEMATNTLLWHLGGTAAMRLGDEKTARRLWKRVLSISPGFTLTQDNLTELSLPIGERHTAWPFTLGYWLRRSVLEALATETAAATSKKTDKKTGSEPDDDQRMAKAVQRTLHKYPELQTLVPMLLERGDPQGREMALMIARFSKSPALLAALRDFALSQNGPDKMRTEAGQLARQANLLPPGPTRLWVDGEWREILLMGFKILFEPTTFYHSTQIRDLAEQARDALHDDDADKAEVLLEEALELEPNSPDLLNNLCKAYEIQGRSDAALVLTEDIHRRFPDYLFARVTLATVHAKEGRVDEAVALLDPLLMQTEFHISEYAALCMAQVELALARHQPEAAKSWVDMLERAAPDYPTTANLRARLAPAKSLSNKLPSKLFSRIWKK